jgi:CRISPR-associated exonuclease Cas4
VTGELEESLHDVTSRAKFLLDQLVGARFPGDPPDADELATTALRTLKLPEIKPYRNSLTAEVPIYGAAPTRPNQLIAGRADAVAQSEDGGTVVFDWKSDIAPKDAERAAYRHQLGQYLHVIGARRGAVVYMTSGRLDWITADHLNITN